MPPRSAQGLSFGNYCAPLCAPLVGTTSRHLIYHYPWFVAAEPPAQRRHSFTFYVDPRRGMDRSTGRCGQCSNPESCTTRSTGDLEELINGNRRRKSQTTEAN